MSLLSLELQGTKILRNNSFFHDYGMTIDIFVKGDTFYFLILASVLRPEFILKKKSDTPPPLFL